MLMRYCGCFNEQNHCMLDLIFERATLSSPKLLLNGIIYNF